MKRHPKYSVPRSEGELASALYHVCYKCGEGGAERKTLYRNGETEDGYAIYACMEHRGLIPQASQRKASDLW